MWQKVGVAAVLTAVLTCGSVSAAPVYFTADAVLPGGLGTLSAERTIFQTAAAGAGIVLATEGFNAFTAGNPIDFGAFEAEVISGSGFSLRTGSDRITTEGTGVLSFSTTGSTSVQFRFAAPINAFGIDITSIDFQTTTVSFADNLGNTLDDFAAPGRVALATFFGVYNPQAFHAVTFTFTGNEILNFDYLQYGATAVPEPATVWLTALGLAAVARSRRRR